MQQKELFEALVANVEQLSKLKSVTDRRTTILQQYYSFQTSEASSKSPLCLHFASCRQSSEKLPLTPDWYFAGDAAAVYWQ